MTSMDRTPMPSNIVDVVGDDVSAPGSSDDADSEGLRGSSSNSSSGAESGMNSDEDRRHGRCTATMSCVVLLL